MVKEKIKRMGAANHAVNCKTSLDSGLRTTGKTHTWNVYQSESRVGNFQNNFDNLPRDEQ